MDLWGVAGCLANRKTIIGWLDEQRAKAGWGEKIAAGLNAAKMGLWLNPMDPCGSLLDEAIRRADESQGKQ